MRGRGLIAGVLAGSFLVSGCADTKTEDVAGALLIGAAVIGIGVLAAGDGDGYSDDDDDDDYSYGRRHRDDAYRYANNGRCDDPQYRTSNGGRAEPGYDERDCGRYGDGLK